jgi:hypothetical protein
MADRKYFNKIIHRLYFSLKPSGQQSGALSCFGHGNPLAAGCLAEQLTSDRQRGCDRMAGNARTRTFGARIALSAMRYHQLFDPDR